ncbi:hypothetical protein BH11MYX4_BH11MYX4_24010 [soil metagenome]
MMTQCPHCGSQVRVTKSGTSGLVTAIGMVLVVVAGGFFVYRTLYNNTSKDAAVIGSHIGQIGE